MAMIFDSHAHYDDERFDGIRDELLFQMPKENVCGILQCAIDYKGSCLAVEYAEKYSCVYAAVGIHPQEVKEDTTFNFSDFEPFLKNKKVVCIGEIGLDYYWDTTFKTRQKEILLKEIEFANAHDLPISFHDREAHADSLEILKATKPKGALHCFSGSPEMAEELLKIGMYIGIGGVVTFKNSKKLQEVAALTPIDRILLETDAPYLAPEPFRGKTNNSAYIKYVARKIAEIKKMSVDEVLEITTENAKTLFKI